MRWYVTSLTLVVLTTTQLAQGGLVVLNEQHAAEVSPCNSLLCSPSSGAGGFTLGSAEPFLAEGSAWVGTEGFISQLDQNHWTIHTVADSQVICFTSFPNVRCHFNGKSGLAKFTYDISFHSSDLLRLQIASSQTNATASYRIRGPSLDASREFGADAAFSDPLEPGNYILHIEATASAIALNDAALSNAEADFFVTSVPEPSLMGTAIVATLSFLQRHPHLRSNKQVYMAANDGVIT